MGASVHKIHEALVVWLLKGSRPLTHQPGVKCRSRLPRLCVGGSHLPVLELRSERQASDRTHLGPVGCSRGSEAPSWCPSAALLQVEPCPFFCGTLDFLFLSLSSFLYFLFHGRRPLYTLPPPRSSLRCHPPTSWGEAAAAPLTPLGPSALVEGRVARSWVPGTAAVKQLSAGTDLRAAHRQQSDTHPSLSVKRPLCSFRSLA